jgi:hypothetical protein
MGSTPFDSVLFGPLRELRAERAAAILRVEWVDGPDDAALVATSRGPEGEPVLRALTGVMRDTVLPWQLRAPVTTFGVHGGRHGAAVVLRPEDPHPLVLTVDGGAPEPITGAAGGVFRDPRLARRPLGPSAPLSVLEVRDGRWALAAFVPREPGAAWTHRALDVPAPGLLEHARLVGCEDRYLLVYKAFVRGAVLPAADGSLPSAPDPAMGGTSLGVLHAAWLDAELSAISAPFRLLGAPVFDFDLDRRGDRLLVLAVRQGGLSLHELRVDGLAVPAAVAELALHGADPLSSPSVFAGQNGARLAVLASAGSEDARVFWAEIPGARSDATSSPW